MECITIERKAIRCMICDELLSENSDKIAFKDFYDIGLFCCDECFNKYYCEVSGKKKGHGIIHEIQGRFRKGDDLKGYRRWIVTQRCWNIRLWE